MKIMQCTCTWNITTYLSDISITFFVTDQILFHFIREIQRSKAFGRGVKRWLHLLCSNQKYQSNFKDTMLISSSTCDIYNTVIRFKMVANKEAKINLQKEIFCWCLLHPMIVNRIQLAYMVSSLSTLGGAYAAMGDFYEHHSIKAGLLSMQQYIVATKVNDPILRSRCKIYFARSLLQQGKLKAAAKIICNEYKMAKKSSEDFALVLRCCIAAWSRYKYLYSLRKAKSCHPCS